MYSVNLENGCWEWSKSLSPTGYGVAHNNGTSTSAHRYVYELSGYIIPDGMELDHLCRNKQCVNPAHLEPVTHSENVKRAMIFTRLLQTHCKDGHLLDGFRTRDEGGRYCKTCNKLNKQAQRLKLKE